MKKRKLCGNVFVNPVGFGGIPIQRISFAEAKAVLNACLDNGINFFDTARVYTDSEEKIGNAISGRRKEFYLATKARSLTKKEMWEEINMSLEKLKTKKIDVYQIHNVKSKEELEICVSKDGAYFALKEAKETGVIGHIGITGHITDTIIKAVETGKFETVQIPFNVIETQNKKIIKRAKELGIGTIIMKPLAGGAFQNADLALKWILNHDVSVIIPGMDSVQQVKENTALAENYKLTKQEKEKLTKESKNIDKNVCRRCEYCLPVCPEHINITLTLLFHAYYKRYGMKKWAKKRYIDMVQEKPDKCTECGACEKACPYNLPIRNMLKQALADFEC